MSENPERNELIELTAVIVSAYVANNTVVASDVPAMIHKVRDALAVAAERAKRPAQPELKPVVSIKRSVTPDYIICLEDGQKFKALKRHLRTHHNLTPEEYREKWGLPHNYPMVAPSYAEARSMMAKKMGFGRKRRA